jgi:glycine/D-amino acid oxidase-like deaminating enzyme
LTGRAGFRFANDRIVIEVPDGEIEAAAVVVAGGAESAWLLDRLGWEVPMKSSPGMLVLTEPTEPALTGTVYVSPVAGPTIHLRQLPDGCVLIGEGSQDYVASKPTMSHALELLRQAQRSFPVLEVARIDQFTLQWRPMPRDGMPIIGPLRDFPLSMWPRATQA